MKLPIYLNSYFHLSSLIILSMFTFAFHCDKSIEPEIKSSDSDRVIRDDDKFLGDNVPEALKKADPEIEGSDSPVFKEDVENYEMPAVEDAAPSK